MPAGPEAIHGRHSVTVTPAVLRDWPLATPGNDKESRGRVLIVGGGRQTPGAVILAAEAALRSGAGKLQVATVESIAAQVAIRLPEAAVFGLPETTDGAIDPAAAAQVLELSQSCAAVLLGSGMMEVDVAREFTSAVLPELSCTAVVDALALSYVSESVRLDHDTVLTPNHKELARMLDVTKEEVEAAPAELTIRLAEATGSVVCSGGPSTWVAGPREGLWEIEMGGPGLGVSGSGDVQAGVVLGLCARGAVVEQAAAWAAYLHGRAGDRLAATVGGVGFLARELPAQIPQVLNEIQV